MDAIDTELERGGGPYFMGAELSLVECVFAPMLERIAASIPYYKGLAVRGSGCALPSSASVSLQALSWCTLAAVHGKAVLAFYSRGHGSSLVC